MTRPGTMLYFDIMEPVQLLSDAERGQLLLAMLRYGIDGTAPCFDGPLAITWGFVKPKIDRDAAAYDATVSRNAYAAFCRECKKHDIPPIPRDVWDTMTAADRKQLLARDINRHPTTAPTASTSSASDPNLSVTADANAINAVANNSNIDPNERRLQIMDGALGRGLVNLSDDQISILLDKLGIDMFDYYVSKLADYIAKYGPISKGHYATILKWWTEDCAT